LSDIDASIEATRAVLPVPGDPEMYMLVAKCEGEGDVMNGLRKAKMAARSVSRPMMVEIPEVGRRSARARAWRDVDGEEGGVARDNLFISREGVWRGTNLGAGMGI
jgi:hypothetical protein